MGWFTEDKEDEATSFAVLGAVKKAGCYPSTFDGESVLQSCEENIGKTRAWAKKLDAGEVRRQYLRWLDYCEREVARYRKDRAMWTRRD